MLPVKANTKLSAEEFLAGSSQNHRVDHKTTSSTSCRPMKPTLNDAYRDRVKQHTNNKEQMNRKQNTKCVQNYPLKYGPYSDEQRQQATR